MFFFRRDAFEKKLYLKEYARKGLILIWKEFGADPKRHRVEICTGSVNIGLKNLLREKGFDVRVVEIKGLLQDRLEDLFKAYVRKELQRIES